MPQATTFLDVAYRYTRQGEDEMVRGGERIKQAAKGVEGQTERLNQRMKTSSGQARKMAGSMALLKGALVALPLAAVVSKLADAQRAWIAQEAAVAGFESRLAATGNVMGLSSTQVQKYAGALQKLTGVGDETTLSQAELLLTFKGIRRQAFEPTIEIAQDMAQVLGQDVRQQTLAVSKSLEFLAAGSSEVGKAFTALSRSGTTFTESEQARVRSLVESGKVQEAQIDLLKVLEGQYGGAARAARQTAGGATKALAGEMGDLNEQIGRLISGGTAPFVEQLVLLVRHSTEAASGINDLAEASGLLSTASAAAAASSGSRVSDQIKQTRLIAGSLALATANWLDYTAASEQATVAVVKWLGASDKASTRLPRLAQGLRSAALALLGVKTAAAEGEAPVFKLAERYKAVTAEANGWEKAMGAAGARLFELEDRLKEQARLAQEAAEAYFAFRQATQDVTAGPLAGGAGGLLPAGATLGQILPSSLPGVDADASKLFADAWDRAMEKLRLGGEELVDPLIEAAPTVGQIFALEAAGAFSEALRQGLASGDMRSAFEGLARSLSGAVGGLVSDVASNALGGGVAGAIGGGILGSIASGLLDSLIGGLFQRGGDQAFAELAAIDGQLQVVAATIEGDLRPALSSMADGIIQTVDMILAQFGGTLQAAVMGFLIREGGDDGSLARVFWLGFEQEFSDRAAAASFLAAKLLSEGVVTGLSVSVAEAVAGGEFESLDELVRAMNIGESIDAELRTPLESFLTDVARSARVLLAEAAPLGISLERVAQAIQIQTQARLDEHRAIVLAAAGVDTMLDSWDELDQSISVLMPASIAEMEQAIEAAAEAAQTLADTGGAEGFLGRTINDVHEWANSLGLGERATERITARWEEMIEAGARQEEIAEALAAELRDLSVELEGLPLDRMRDAARVMQFEFMGGLLGRMSELLRQTGNVEAANRLEAKSKELVLRAQILQIRATVQEAFARERLTATQVQGFNELIRQMQRGLNELIRTGGFMPAAPGAGGGGGGRGIADEINEQARAAEAYADMMQRLTDQIEGVTAAERQRIEAEERLHEWHRQEFITALELEAGLQALDAAARAAEESLGGAERRLERIGDKSSILGIGARLAELAGNEEAAARLRKDILALEIEGLMLKIDLAHEEGRISEDRWQRFQNFGERALRELERDIEETFDPRGPVSDLRSAMTALGEEMPVEVARALAHWEFQSARAKALEAIATMQAAQAAGQLTAALAGVDWAGLAQTVAGLEFSFDAPPASGGRGTIPRGLGRPPRGTGSGEEADPLEGLLERLGDWERQIEISLMDPLEASLARARDRGEEFIRQLEEAGARQADIDRAHAAMLRELEQISARAWEAALDPLRDLFTDLTSGPLSGAASDMQIEASRARFEDLQARAAGGDIEAARQLAGAGRELLQLAEGSNDRLLIRAVRDLVRGGVGDVLGVSEPGGGGLDIKPHDVIARPVTLTASDLIAGVAAMDPDGHRMLATALPLAATAFAPGSAGVKVSAPGIETELRQAHKENEELRALVRELLAAQRERNAAADEADDVKIELSAAQVTALSDAAAGARKASVLGSTDL